MLAARMSVRDVTLTFLADKSHRPSRSSARYAPTECGRATLPSVGRRYIFSLDGLPRYVRERKCRHATLPLRSASCMHSRRGAEFTLRGSRYVVERRERRSGPLEAQGERPQRAGFRRRSWTFDRQNRFSIYGASRCMYVYTKIYV